MICSECRQPFTPNRGSLTCSPVCRSDRVKRVKHERYVANAELVKSKAKAYRDNNPDKIKALRKKYRETYGERQREKSRDYYRENSERLKEYAREYRRANPEVIRKVNRRIRAERRGAPTEAYMSDLIISIYGSLCNECGLEIDLYAPRLPGAPGWEMSLHLDHVTPLSSGGTDLIDNIRPTHARCNLRKARRFYRGADS